MWNKRREEEPQRPYTPPGPAPAAVVHNPSVHNPSVQNPSQSTVELKKEGTAMSSTPQARFEPESRGGSAAVGKAVKIVGQIYTKEDLYVDGEVEGTVEATEHKLTVGPNGLVKATVRAREVVVLGSITGNVEATDKLEIRKDAKLIGDIKTARIIIEDGAYFKGSIDIVKPEPAKAPSKPAAPANPPASAAHATAAPSSANTAEVKR
jgi:cytoskeletal protein CcmA (bactofilin family)